MPQLHSDEPAQPGPSSDAEFLLYGLLHTARPLMGSRYCKSRFIGPMRLTAEAEGDRFPVARDMLRTIYKRCGGCELGRGSGTS